MRKRVDLSSLGFTDNGICSSGLFRKQEKNSIDMPNISLWTDVPAGTFVRIPMDGSGTNDNSATDGTLLYSNSQAGLNAAGEQIIAYTGAANGSTNCGGGNGSNTYISCIEWNSG